MTTSDPVGGGLVADEDQAAGEEPEARQPAPWTSPDGTDAGPDPDHRSAGQTRRETPRHVARDDRRPVVVDQAASADQQGIDPAQGTPGRERREVTEGSASFGEDERGHGLEAACEDRLHAHLGTDERLDAPQDGLVADVAEPLEADYGHPRSGRLVPHHAAGLHIGLDIDFNPTEFGHRRPSRGRWDRHDTRSAAGLKPHPSTGATRPWSSAR